MCVATFVLLVHVRGEIRGERDLHVQHITKELHTHPVIVSNTLYL